MVEQLGVVAAIAAYAVFAMASVLLVRVDLREHRLPNRVLAWSTGVVLVLLVLASWLSGEWGRLGGAVLASVSYGVVVLVLWSLGRGALGAGDLKLSPLLGLVAGWLGFDVAGIWVPVAIVVLGAAAALLARRRGVGEFAFGPTLLAGTWVGIGVGAMVV